MPFSYIELGNYTNLGSGMGPPARPPVRKMGHRHIKKGPCFALWNGISHGGVNRYIPYVLRPYNIVV